MMNDKELGSLEKDALSLRDAKDREEALSGISELRSLRARLDEEVAMVARQASHGPAREPMPLLKSIRLHRGLKSEDVDIKNWAIDEMRQRREMEEQLRSQKAEKLKSPVYREQVKARFRSRKLAFRFLGLLLVLIMFLVATNARSWGWTHDVTALTLVLALGLVYWYAGKRLWRRPACNFRFPILPNSARSKVQLCRRCGASLS